MAESRRRRVVVFGFLLGTTFLVVALRGTNLREIADTLARAEFWLAIPFLVILLGLYWVRALRWAVLLGPLRGGTTGGEVFPAVMIGFASNIMLPPPLSDFVRMYIAGRRLKVRNTAVLATIVVERIFDLLTIVLLLGLALAVSPKPTEDLRMVGYVGAFVAAAVLALAVAYVTWTDFFGSLLHRIVGWLPFPEHLTSFLKGQIDLVASGFMALKSARRVLVVSTLTLVQWGLMAVGIYLSLLAVRISVHPSAAVVILAFTFVGVTLPSTPGAVGTIQLSFTLALAPFGVSAGNAVSASIFWHAIAYAFVVSLGALFFVRLGYTLREIRDHAQVEREEDPE